MLKHVHTSTASLSPFRCIRSQANDALSLNSSLSFGSGGAEHLSSRSSSTSSLHEALQPRKTMVKVYARVLCADMEYKTMSIDPSTTSSEVVRILLSKFKMKHRDPNLFYLTMEVWMRKTGIPIRTIMVLDDEARPVELQSCHPKGESKFLLQMRRGGLVKVYDSCLMAGSLYKSLLVSERTTAEEVVQLVLHCYNSTERASKFSLFEVCPLKNYERVLHPHELPLRIQQNWASPEHFAFHLRRNQDSPKRQLPWKCQTDVSGHLNFRLNSSRSELSPVAIHSPTLKPSYNNYENCFYI